MSRTQWTAPRAGATLQELMNNFPEIEKLKTLAAQYGADTKTPLALFPKQKKDEVDVKRLEGSVFADNIKYNSKL